MNRVERAFRTMGCEASVRIESAVLATGELEVAADRVEATLHEVDRTLSRFREDSELSALNRDPRRAVPASDLVRRLALAAHWAGRFSNGLVDVTMLHELEEQGYRESRDGVAPACLDAALASAPPREPAAAAASRRFALIGVDAERRVVRPPGVVLDSGGLGKGLAVDVAAERLPDGVRYAIGCGGDLAVGTWPAFPWEIGVRDVRTGDTAHRVRARTGGVATSGIDARLWQRPDGTFAHHVLDPATGKPAWTGLVAATAVAGSGLEAEVLAKTALLAGPLAARRVLRVRGGVLQHDSGRVEVVHPAAVIRLARGAVVGAAA
ncbi:MAG: FAD:protein transferase [Thermoleophilaceae bacterium]|nr:FAD:protein transferase [Thermoleophilaceae bacterium]